MDRCGFAADEFCSEPKAQDGSNAARDLSFAVSCNNTKTDKLAGCFNFSG